MPNIKISSLEELGFYKKRVKTAIDKTAESLKKCCSEESIKLFSSLKFQNLATLPYGDDSNNQTNFMEFLNQLYTTAVSYKAIEWLKGKLQREESTLFSLCLGTTAGRDLTWILSNNDIIIVEIFAVTNTSSNDKLKKEIQSLAKSLKNEDPQKIKKRYAIFVLRQDEFHAIHTDVKPVQSIARITNYTPKDNSLNKNAIEISTDANTSPIVGDDYMQWQCKCDKKTIDIVCFSQCYIDQYITKIN